MNTKRPNILILMCDQMQHKRMGFLDPVAYTPNLDQLADEGVHFSHAISSQGQCVPARAAFMTGQPAHQCGVMVNYGFFEHQNMMTSCHCTLPNVLRDTGYRTVHFGKRHFGKNLEDLGFDVWDDFEEHEIDDAEVAELGLGYVPKQLQKEYRAAFEAVNFLQNYQLDEKPLYFVFSTNLPHPPFFTEKNYIERFPLEQLSLPSSFYEETFETKPAFQKEHVEDGRHGAFDEEEMKQELADYYSMIAAMDEHFGMVIDEFKRLGIWDNTLLLMFADHGDMMGAHKMHLKGTLPYDELYRIPCIFKLPDGTSSARTTIDDLVSSDQIAATILKQAGLEVPESFCSGDFADAFNREKHPDGEAVFFEHYAAYWGTNPFYAVRTRKLKYIYYYSHDIEEMYDLDKDPNELINIANNSEYQEQKEKLAKLVNNWWEQTEGKGYEYYDSDHFRSNKHNLL